jgi:DNA sulfur modification protein DndB
LYAFSGSDLAKTQSIPVVAFENLDKHEQLQLFMDINENQKSVPKALRVTLNGDMLWTSSIPAERRLAIASKIAQEMEDTKSSKLYGRIVVGENEAQENRRVTIAALQDALEKSGFLNKYSKDGMKLITPGLLDFDDNDKTKQHIYDLLDLCFSHIYDHCSTAWNMTEADSTIVVTNRGIQAIIRIVADIMKYLKMGGHIQDPKHCEPDDYAQDIVNFLDPLCDYINQSTVSTRKELRLIVGANGDTRFWREFQKVVHGRFPSFNPDGLDKYLQDETKQYNESTKQNLLKIMDIVKEKIEDNFFSKYATVGEQLLTFPKGVYDRLSKEVNDYKYQYQGAEDVDFKSFMTFSDLLSLVTKAPYWNDTFCALFSDPNGQKNAGKKVKTSWMQELADLDKNLKNPVFSVSKEKADRVSKILEWLSSSD